MSELVCTNCGMTFARAAILCLLEDSGAKVYPSGLFCRENTEHDFQSPTPAVAESEAA